MQLSKRTIETIKPSPGLTIPGTDVFSLPEKVLQFGTGVLLRGLPDYFIDKANRNGVFNGRVVMVKSTSQGSSDAFDVQDGLYTLYVRGIENGTMAEEAIINASISRVLSAKEDWASVLKCAHNAEMRIVISNTTEVGIVLIKDDITLSPPVSFPGKLLAFLYERYKAFKGIEESGMLIIPTELIVDNGTKLRSIVLELAEMNGMDKKFIGWLQSANHFCSSLVDRIVPGKLPEAERKAVEEKFGYTDDLMIMAETFRLWVIESADQRVRDILSFSSVDSGIVITPDIEKFRELKLRLLNGTHTFSCAVAYLAGFTTVKEAMQDEAFLGFVRRLMLHEIAPAMENNRISYEEACTFANQVADRFSNPFLDHQWISISMNFTSKMKLRNIPLLLAHYNKTNTVPSNMALGFAAYLLFMKCEASSDSKYQGELNGRKYTIQDESAGYFAAKWTSDKNAFVDSVLADNELWGADLSKLEGFAKAVKENLQLLEQQGAAGVLNSMSVTTVA